MYCFMPTFAAPLIRGHWINPECPNGCYATGTKLSQGPKIKSRHHLAPKANFDPQIEI